MYFSKNVATKSEKNGTSPLYAILIKYQIFLIIFRVIIVAIYRHCYLLFLKNHKKVIVSFYNLGEENF